MVCSDPACRDASRYPHLNGALGEADQKNIRQTRVRFSTSISARGARAGLSIRRTDASISRPGENGELACNCATKAPKLRAKGKRVGRWKPVDQRDMGDWLAITALRALSIVENLLTRFFPAGELRSPSTPYGGSDRRVGQKVGSARQCRKAPGRVARCQLDWVVCTRH